MPPDDSALNCPTPAPIRPPLFITGATATGKSEVALLLAEQLHGEIISVDSMQVYRGLDIGTAKPSSAERQRVRHHLIDIVSLADPFDAAKFVVLANHAVTDIQGRGKLPVFCGGTGFYLKAFLEGLGEAPPADPALRHQLEAIPLPELLAELAVRDPVAYETIDCQNPRRVRRAIEVIRLTGKPFSEQRTSTGRSRGENSGSNTPRCFALSRAPADLHLRIERRVDAMFAQGLVAETEHLLQNGLAENVTAMQSIGYRQVVDHLQGGRGLAETISLVKIRTRQFAKRQATWFRRQLPTTWITCVSDEEMKNVAGRLLEAAAR